MLIKTSTLTGPALDLAVSKADNAPGPDGWGWFERDAKGYLFDPLNECRYSPSTNWAQGGPIIEREEIEVFTARAGGWMANLARTKGTFSLGPTPLIAAMRCYVARKLGDTVEVPDDLC